MEPTAKAAPSTLQSFPYPAAIQAIKDASRYADFDTFYRHLVEDLPQNSPETRKRFATLIVRWFFPERSLTGFLPTVWASYQDERLLNDLMRVTTLEIEPVIAAFAVDVILPFGPGDPFPADLARTFVTATYHEYKADSHKRLTASIRSLGFLSHLGNEWVVNALPQTYDAILLLLHNRMAQSPRIVRVSDLLDQPFVKYLGYRDADSVRTVLRRAADAGLLARYSVVDELEQITTRFTAEEYIARRSKL